jgi:hypothetical protein
VLQWASSAIGGRPGLRLNSSELWAMPAGLDDAEAVVWAAAAGLGWAAGPAGLLRRNHSTAADAARKRGVRELTYRTGQVGGAAEARRLTQLDGKAALQGWVLPGRDAITVTGAIDPLVAAAGLPPRLLPRQEKAHRDFKMWFDRADRPVELHWADEVVRKGGVEALLYRVTELEWQHGTFRAGQPSHWRRSHFPPNPVYFQHIHRTTEEICRVMRK